jgi:protein-disulfide isomerase
MPSGKKSKQMRRAAATAQATPPSVRSKGGIRRRPLAAAPPPVVSKGAPRGRQASPRVLAIGGGVVAVIVVAIVLAVVLGGKASSGIPKGVPTIGSATSAVALPNSADVRQLFKGIPQNGPILGNPKAPVTMREYIDLQCPVCQAFETEVFPDLVKNYVRPGKVKVEMRPWAFIGPDSFRGQAATIAAIKQNKGFQFAQLLYFNQGTENTGWMTDSVLAFDAASIDGMNVKTLFADRGSSSVKNGAKTVDEQAASQHVSATPTLFVGRSGHALKKVALQNGLDRESITTALNDALAGL